MPLSRVPSGVGTTEVSFKNRIINGAIVIDQRNNGASVTPASGADTFPVDRFSIYSTQASKTTAQQNQGSVTPPSGFRNYLGITSSSAYAVVASDLFGLFHNIEGFNVADLNWGTANAQTVTLSFWVRSSLTGTFGGAILNSAQDRSYPFTYTINSANTWEYETITIPGDTTGTWLTTNGRGMTLCWNLGMGSSRVGTANAWAAAGNFAPTGATSVVGTSGATFQITGVQLEKGSTATAFDYRQYGTELALCQRYYEWGAASGSGYAQVTAIFDAGSTSHICFKVSKRASPTMTNMTLAGDQYPNPQNAAVPRYENGYARGFRYTSINDTTFWNVTTGNGGSTGVAGHQIVWNANSEI
jgi:hypothetical protein